MGVIGSSRELSIQHLAVRQQELTAAHDLQTWRMCVCLAETGVCDMHSARNGTGGSETAGTPQAWPDLCVSSLAPSR